MITKDLLNLEILAQCAVELHVETICLPVFGQSGDRTLVCSELSLRVLEKRDKLLGIIIFKSFQVKNAFFIRVRRAVSKTRAKRLE